MMLPLNVPLSVRNVLSFVSFFVCLLLIYLCIWGVFITCSLSTLCSVKLLNTIDKDIKMKSLLVVLSTSH